MANVFIDTSFFIAMLRERDTWHELAIARSEELDRRKNISYVTTHLVFAELLAHVARGGATARRAACDFVEHMLRRDDLTVAELSEDLFGKALGLYRARADQRYSLADCVSMIVCTTGNILEVLTADSDFEHEGFQILLKDAP